MLYLGKAKGGLGISFQPKVLSGHRLLARVSLELCDLFSGGRDPKGSWGLSGGREEMRNTFPVLEKGKSRMYQDPVKPDLLALSLFKAGNKSAPKIPMFSGCREKAAEGRRGRTKADLAPRTG